MQILKIYTFIPHIFFKNLWVLVFVLAQTPFNAQDTINNTQEKLRINFATVPHTKQTSLKPFYKALKNADYGIQRFSIFDQLAEHHIRKGNTDSIMYYGNQYTQELKKWDRPATEKKTYYAKAYYVLGQGSKSNGLLDNAVKWHINGISNAEESGNSSYEYRNKIGLAEIYNLKEAYEKAIQVLEIALATFQKEEAPLNQRAFLSMGDAYLGLKAYDKSKEYYEQALSGAQKFKDLEQELFIQLKLGTLAERENRIEDAFNLYNDAREIGLENGYNVIYFEGTIRLGNIYYNAGNYDVTKIALSVALVNAVNRENLYYQQEILNILRQAHAATGDYENAYALMTQLQVAEHKENSQQQLQIIRELEIQYETLQKEKEILTLEENKIKREADLQRQKTIKIAFLIGFLVILIPIIALLYVYYQKIQAQSELAKKQEEINQQKVTALMQDQELNLIKATIEGQDEERNRIAQELHDSIGGNLAGIKLQLTSLTKGSSTFTTITKQLDETYQLVRDISHTLIPKKFRQQEFTQLIEEYITSIQNTGELQMGFYPYPEDTVNKIDEVVRIELFKIMQELTTNTLKHAQAKKIDIHLNCFDEGITLLFEDDGLGFDTSETTYGIGFQNIKNRVAKIKGVLHIDTALNRGTVISIEILKKDTL